MVKAPGDKTRDLVMEIIWWHNAIGGYNITFDDLKSHNRVVPIMNCRADCWRRLREVRGWSYPRLGRYFGSFDHSTVMHHCRQTVVANKPIKNKKRLTLAELQRQRELNRWQRILAKTKRVRGMAGATTNSGELHHEPA